MQTLIFAVSAAGLAACTATSLPVALPSLSDAPYASIAHPAPVRPEGTPGSVSNLNLLLGNRNLKDERFWEPVDELKTIGIGFNTYVLDSGFGTDFGFDYSTGTETLLGVDVDAKLLQFDFGGRKTWGQGREGWNTYIGAGLALIAASIDIGNGFFDEVAGGVGVYLRGGAYYSIANVNLGFDYKLLSGTDITFDGFAPTDVDGGQISLVVGYSF